MATSTLQQLCRSLGKIRIDHAVRASSTYQPPRYRPPHWFVQKERVRSNDNLTLENKEFLQEVLQDRLHIQEEKTSPLAQNVITPTAEWDTRTRRAGLIVKKIGNYPMWLKDGTKVQTTLVQVLDNHVIKYIPPEDFKPMVIRNRNYREKRTLGCLLVGAETVDPSAVTKEYCGIFNSVGMLPKRHIHRFMISPHAVLPSGTPLLATHYRVGDYVDVMGKTIDRGFQGVMKRWGFKGMPASHGVTKTHRRPGNIGAGGNKARVWPGTKMPGHMGNSWRTLRGVKILRINTEYNVMWMLGVGIPGETGSVCYLYDTLLPKRKATSAPPFPTQLTSDNLPQEYFDESVHMFDAPTITYEETN